MQSDSRSVSGRKFSFRRPNKWGIFFEKIYTNVCKVAFAIQKQISECSNWILLKFPETERCFFHPNVFDALVHVLIIIHTIE